MKITAIESLYWRAYPRLLVVRVHTDEGLIGLGETVDKIPGSRGALHGTLAPLLLGRDPLDIEGIWQDLTDVILYHGFAGAEMRALSAVDLALWDLMGKVYGAPVYHVGDVERPCPHTTPVPDMGSSMITPSGNAMLVSLPVSC